MITRLAVHNYRSLLKLTVQLGPLTVITGPNGSGKSNLYKALRLLAQTARGGVVNALALDGGLQSTFWAGPVKLSRAMKRGDVPVQGTHRNRKKRLRLGFAGEDFSYAIALGLPAPIPGGSAFDLDPEIKHECIWAGEDYRRAAALIERDNNIIKSRNARKWDVIDQHCRGFESLFSRMADVRATPEAFTLRETIRSWRFYDHFRTDIDAPARQPQIGTRTPVLSHDGRDLAAAIQTINEVGDSEALHSAVEDAFPGATLHVAAHSDGRFTLEFHQYGLLRPLTAAELSDGTLRYLLLIAALLTPRPPALLILNEPETSLHPDLLPALARLIISVSEHTQVWVVSHANRLVNALNQHTGTKLVALEKQLGETVVDGQGMLDGPPWQWPDK